VLPYVLLWSNRAVIHLDRDDIWTNPPGPQGAWKDPPKSIQTHLSDPRPTAWRERYCATSSMPIEERMATASYIRRPPTMEVVRCDTWAALPPEGVCKA
jgi:hypothetical protein